MMSPSTETAIFCSRRLVTSGQWREYVREDNRLSAKVYSALEFGRLAVADLAIERLIGVFQYDFIKLLTGLIFRVRELDCGLVADEGSNLQPLNVWPYIGYGDLLGRVSIGSRRYGKILRMPSGPAHVRLVQRLCAHIPFASATVSFSGSNPIFRSVTKKCLSRRRRVTWPVPAFDPALVSSDTLAALSVYAEEVCASLGDIIPRALRLPEVMVRHVSGTAEMNPAGPLDCGDVLVTGSLVELGSRVLAERMRFSGKPVLTVLHGDSFGVLDHPVFGLGEQGFASAVVGYGPAFVKERAACDYVNWPGVEYIESDSELVRGMANRYESRPWDGSCNFLYVPTSLRGNQVRHGPFQDMPDALYLALQQEIIGLLGSENVTLKMHPKERFAEIARAWHGETRAVYGDVRDYLESPCVFVFDYFSTAFCYAAASGRPIIFFDLGLQKFAPGALEAIKSRAVYVTPDEVGVLDFATLRQRLREHDFGGDFSSRYSLASRPTSRLFAIDQWLARN